MLTFVHTSDTTSLLRVGMWCWTDWNYAKLKGGGVYFNTLPQPWSKGAHESYVIPPANGMGSYPGGAAGIVSRGSAGYLGVAVGPDPQYSTPYNEQTATQPVFTDTSLKYTDRLTVGLAAVPDDVRKCSTSGDAELSDPDMNCDVSWIPSDYLTIGGDDGRKATNNFPNTKFGFPVTQHVGPGGEEGSRFLLGWASNVRWMHGGSKYHVVEVDAQGSIHGEITELDVAAGWNEEDRWTALPKSGCVAFPYVWDGEVDSNGNQHYGAKHRNGGPDETNVEGLVDTIRITRICPSSPKSSTSPTGCTANCKNACPAGSAGPSCEFTDAATCNGRGVALDTGVCVCSSSAAGKSCEHTDEISCNGNGAAQFTGSCECNAGAAGPSCEFTDAATCRDRGVALDTGVCECGGGFGGSTCEYSDAADCGGRGKVFTTADGTRPICMCNDGFGGDDCACSKSDACLGAVVIHGNSGAWVGGLTIEQPTGERSTYGSTGGSDREVLRLQPGEHLVKVTHWEMAESTGYFGRGFGWGFDFETSAGRQITFKNWYPVESRVVSNVFEAPAGRGIYKLNFDGKNRLVSGMTVPFGAGLCSAGKHCSGNGVAFGNDAEGCQCVCNDGFGGDDCSCSKSDTCLGAMTIIGKRGGFAIASLTFELPTGEQIKYGDTTSSDEVIAKLLPDEFLTSVTQWEMGEHTGQKGNGLGWGFDFETSAGRQFGYQNWFPLEDRELHTTVVAPAGSRIATLEFTSRRLTGGVMLPIQPSAASTTTLTTTGGSTDGHSAPACQSWCLNHPNDWAIKCAWTSNACSACNECPTTTIPIVPPHTTTTTHVCNSLSCGVNQKGRRPIKK